MKQSAQEYKENNEGDDHLADFLDARSNKVTYEPKEDNGVNRKQAVERDELRLQFHNWCTKLKRFEPKQNNTSFTRRMSKLGYKSQKSGSCTWFLGLTLVDEWKKHKDEDNEQELEEKVTNSFTPASTTVTDTDSLNEDDVDAWTWVEVGHCTDKIIRYPPNDTSKGKIFEYTDDGSVGAEIGECINGKPMYYKK
jgi:hypothetical protein